MGSGGSKQVKTISFGLCQGLLMPKHNPGRVILEFAEGYETLAFKLQAIVGGESLKVAVNGGFRVLSENSFSPPVAEGSRGSGVRIIFRTVAGFTLAQNDPDQVIRAGGIVTVLHRRSDLVIRLGSDFGYGDLGGIVAKRAEGFYVGH